MSGAAFVAFLGSVPTAVATGTGAEGRKPIATVVIGGPADATLLNPVVLPAPHARFGSADPTSSAGAEDAKPRPVPAPEEQAQKRAAEPTSAERDGALGVPGPGRVGTGPGRPPCPGCRAGLTTSGQQGDQGRTTPEAPWCLARPRPAPDGTPVQHGAA